MTNGEKFQQIFAVSQVDECDLNVYAWLPSHDAIEIPLEWWNANYSEIPIGSTKYCDRSICLKNGYNNVGCEDCEVTKSQESSGDNVVSRDVAKKQMIMYGFHAPDMTVTEFVEDLPSVTPQEPRWIPVSEKLPEPFTFVNATCRSLVDDRENWVVETLYLPIPKEVNKRGYSDWGNIPMLNWGEAEVIAWVERIIPQPYKAETEADNG